jgi:dihydrofolate reductase
MRRQPTLPVAGLDAGAQNRDGACEVFTMRASVFVGTSVDGFIARSNHELDFLPENGGEPHGYREFIATVDVLVIGRNTFDKVLTFDQWPYDDMRVVVLTHRAMDTSTLSGAHVERMSGPPPEIVNRLAASGAQHAYIDGGITVQQFLRAGLIQRLIITRVPVLVGQGIPLFGSLPRDVRLRHVATQSYASGLVKSEYEVAG